jgi:hypothetical protein
MSSVQQFQLSVQTSCLVINTWQFALLTMRGLLDFANKDAWGHVQKV